MNIEIVPSLGNQRPIQSRTMSDKFVKLTMENLLHGRRVRLEKKQ